MLQKKFPIDFLKAVEDVVKKKYSLLIVTPSDSSPIMRFTERNDIESPFYFHINGIAKNNDSVLYDISYTPSGRNHPSLVQFKSKLDALISHLNTWIELIEEYNQDNIIFDDPITQSYFNELGDTVKITDSDADYAPFDYPTQELFHGIYDRAKLLIEGQKTENNAEEADDLIKEIEEAKNNTQNQTKSQVIQKLKKIGAKFMKYGFEVGKEFAIQAAVEISKRYLMGSN
jgi:hypothetical protein